MYFSGNVVAVKGVPIFKNNYTFILIPMIYESTLNGYQCAFCA